MKTEMPSTADRLHERIADLEALLLEAEVEAEKDLNYCNRLIADLRIAEGEKDKRIEELEGENKQLFRYRAFVANYDIAAEQHAMPSWLDDARLVLKQVTALEGE